MQSQSQEDSMTELWDYQVDAVEKIEQTTKALYVLPTGGGKTIIATRLIERAVERGERILVLTHRREILKQTSLKLLLDHGLIQAGLNIDLKLSGASRKHCNPLGAVQRQGAAARCQSDHYRRGSPHRRPDVAGGH
jgi:superfamily II DNA or RNA helicase